MNACAEGRCHCAEICRKMTSGVKTCTFTDGCYEAQALSGSR
jgi:hypothetical protein